MFSLVSVRRETAGRSKIRAAVESNNIRVMQREPTLCTPIRVGEGKEISGRSVRGNPSLSAHFLQPEHMVLKKLA